MKKITKKLKTIDKGILENNKDMMNMSMSMSMNQSTMFGIKKAVLNEYKQLTQEDRNLLDSMSEETKTNNIQTLLNSSTILQIDNNNNNNTNNMKVLAKKILAGYLRGLLESKKNIQRKVKFDQNKYDEASQDFITQFKSQLKILISEGVIFYSETEKTLKITKIENDLIEEFNSYIDSATFKSKIGDQDARFDVLIYYNFFINDINSKVVLII